QKVPECILTRAMRYALRLHEALHKLRLLSHCLLPVPHTLPQLFQYAGVIYLERMNRFQEKVDIAIVRPQAYSLKHPRCLNYALAVVLVSEGPVVITGSVCLLQVYYRRVRPGLSEPREIIIACCTGIQSTWMSKVEAKNEWHSSLKGKISDLLRFLDAISPLSRHCHILKQEELQPAFASIARKEFQALSHLREKCLLTTLVGHVSYAQCSQVTSSSQGAELCGKINRSFVPVHSRVPHHPVGMQ